SRYCHFMIDDSSDDEGSRRVHEEERSVEAPRGTGHAKQVGAVTTNGSSKPKALSMASELFDDELEHFKGGNIASDSPTSHSKAAVASPTCRSTWGSDIKKSSPTSRNRMEGSAGKEVDDRDSEAGKNEETQRLVSAQGAVISENGQARGSYHSATQTVKRVASDRSNRNITPESISPEDFQACKKMKKQMKAEKDVSPIIQDTVKSKANRKSSPVNGSKHNDDAAGAPSQVCGVKKSLAARKRKKATVAPEMEKEIRKMVRLEVQKKRSDAKNKVLNKFKKELPWLRERSIFSQPATNDEADRVKDIDLPRLTPPSPSTPSALSALPGLQRAKLISCSNFIYTFARPLGLLAVPTLPELAQALLALDQPEEAGCPLAEAEGRKKEAARLIEDLCIALVRAVTPDVEYVLGLKSGHTGDLMEEVCSSKSGLIMPLNKLTWKEIARLSLVMFIYSYLGFSDKDIAECMRGRINPRRNKVTLKLLKARLERRAALAVGKRSLKSSSKDGFDANNAAENTIYSSTREGYQEVGDTENGHVGIHKDSERLGREESGDISICSTSCGARKEAATAPNGGGKDHARKANSSDVQFSDRTKTNDEDTLAETAEDKKPSVTPTSAGAEKERLEDTKSDGEEEKAVDEEDEEEEEEEEMAVEMSRELDAILEEACRSEQERRVACLLKRLLQHSCSERVGTEGTEDPDIESSLSDYVLNVWEPLTVATLILKLKRGSYSADGTEAGGLLELVQDVELLCRNSWACNIEDSEAWGAAEKFHAIFDRLLQAWVLEQAPEKRLSVDEMRGLCQDLVEPCSACRQPLSRHTAKVICCRCALTLHPDCHRSLTYQDENRADVGVDIETDLWHCTECLDFRVRREAYPALGFDEEDKQGDLLPQDYVEATDHLSAQSRDMLLWLRMVVGEWGPGMSFPPLLDVTVSRTALGKIKADPDLLGIWAALALLGGRVSDAHKEIDACKKATEMTEAGHQLLILDSLCQAASTHSGIIRSFLERQDQKLAALRKRPPKEEEELRKELQDIGGDAAVLAWKDPMTEEYMAEEAAAAAVEEGEEGDDEDGENGEDQGEEETAVCCECKATTKDVDDSQVVLCESCPTEIHLRCLNPNLTEAPEKEWFCRVCKAKKREINKQRQRQRFVVKAVDVDDLLEGQRLAIENALLEDFVEEKIQERLTSDEKKKKEKKTVGSSGTQEAAFVLPGGSGVFKQGEEQRRSAGDAAKVKEQVQEKGSFISTSSATPSSTSEGSLRIRKAMRLKCEYCGYGEMEVCSPLVLGQTLAETEQYVALEPAKDPWISENLRKRNPNRELEVTKKSKSSSESSDGKGVADIVTSESVSRGKNEQSFFAEKIGQKQGHDGGDGESMSQSGQLNAARAADLSTISAPPAVAPYFPRIDTAESRRFPFSAHCPIVHERCAIQMLAFRARALHDQKLQGQSIAASDDQVACQQGTEGHGVDKNRKNAVQQMNKKDPRAVIEAALRISGTRTYSLGQDRHGRCYWKIPGDEMRLYVWVRPEEGDAQVKGTDPQLPLQGGAEGMASVGPGTWLCYQDSEDIRRLADYLDTRHSKEGRLREAIEAELLGEPKVRVPRDDSMFVRNPSGDSGGPKLDGLEEGLVEGAGFDDDAKTVSTDGVEEGGGEQAMETKKVSRPVALKFWEEKNQSPVPSEVLDIEVDPDIWGDSLERKAAVRKTRKYHAVVLVDAEDKVWEGRNLGVRFQIFKGGEEVEESSTPRAHKDHIFWFNVYEFLLPGLYTLRYTVDTFSREIKPLCLRVEVRARRAATSVRSVLNSHLSFLNISRGGRYSLRQSVELDIPEDADEVVGLRIALLQLKETLPNGALLESPEDLGGSIAHLGGGGSTNIHAGDGEVGPVRAPVCYWTEALQAQWINHLMEAETPHEVMEGLLLLESCLHPEWLKPWFHPLRRSYAATSSHLLRLGTTAAAAAFHLFILDKAILYDKERKVPRKSRGQSARSRGFHSTQRSVLEGESDEEDDDEEETESEEDCDSDDNGGRKRLRSRKHKKRLATGSSSSHVRGVKHPQRSSFRKRAVVSYKEAGDNDIFDEESDEGSSISTRESGAQSNGGSRTRPRTGAVLPIASDDEFSKECLALLRQLKSHPSAGPFIEDVGDNVPGYSTIVPFPVSLTTLEARVRRQVYGTSLEKFSDDVGRLWENSVLYNGEDHAVTRMALQLKVRFEAWHRDMKPRLRA
ncbi:bromodomain containing protein, partial [Nannochloropsis gaditana CCMP526]|uniref:bromodomain containing protein n=1 Tax=Nannochloropsis gaditana (strain CCMP526) TaxID=1093141 RepID=UPI00029F5954